MHSSTSLQGSGLVRSVGPCAQMGGHRDAFSNERKAHSAGLRASRFARGEVDYSLSYLLIVR